MKTIAERFRQELKEGAFYDYDNGYEINEIASWLERQPENNQFKPYWVIAEGSNIPKLVDNRFTVDELEAACREAWNAGRFAMSAYMEDQQYTCLEAWIKQYKAKIMGGK